MRRYDAVVFDLDGTLLDTLGDLTDAVNAAMERFSLKTWTIDDVRGFVGNGIRRLLRLCVPGGEENERFEEIFAFFKGYYTEHCRVKTAPYGGILLMLRRLHAEGFKLAVVSNKNDEAVKSLCGDFFGGVLSTAVGERPKTRKKPAPDMVLRALEEIACEKSRAIYVGDSEVDSETAQNAGLDCLLVSWGFRERNTLQKLAPIGILDEPEEIFGFLY